MGSKLETLPPSAAPPTSTSVLLPLSLPLSPSRSRCPSLVGTSFRSAPLKGCHAQCRMYSPLPASASVRSYCKPTFEHHYFTASSDMLTSANFHQDDVATRLLHQDTTNLSGVCNQKVRNGFHNEQMTASKSASLLKQFHGFLPMHQFLPVCGTTGASHRLPFPTLVVHSLVKTSPFVLEVTRESEIKMPQGAVPETEHKDPCTLLSKSDSSPSPLQSCANESAGILSSEQLAPSRNGAEVCELSRPLPDENLSGSCHETAAPISRDIRDTESSCDVDRHPTSRDIGSVSTTAELDDVAEENSDDKNDADDFDDDCSDDDDTFDECADTAGPDESHGGLVVSEDWGLTTNLLTSSLCAGPCSESMPSHCLPLQKLLSEESGYCEGVSSEDGGKAESSWWQPGTEEDEDEVDWDAEDSDDSGSKVAVDEELLQSFKDFALSPQVVSASPKPPLPTPIRVSITCVTPASVSPQNSCCMEAVVCNCALSSRTDKQGKQTINASSAHRVHEHSETPEHCSTLNSPGTAAERADAGHVCPVATPKHNPRVSTHRHQRYSSSSCKGTNQHSRQVHFAEDSELTSVRQICVWRFAYRAARKGPWEQFARDHAHFRRRIANVALVLEPCLAARRAAVNRLVSDSVES